MWASTLEINFDIFQKFRVQTYVQNYDFENRETGFSRKFNRLFDWAKHDLYSQFPIHIRNLMWNDGSNALRLF